MRFSLQSWRYWNARRNNRPKAKPIHPSVITADHLRPAIDAVHPAGDAVKEVHHDLNLESSAVSPGTVWNRLERAGDADSWWTVSVRDFWRTGSAESMIADRWTSIALGWFRAKGAAESDGAEVRGPG